MNHFKSRTSCIFKILILNCNFVNFMHLERIITSHCGLISPRLAGGRRRHNHRRLADRGRSDTFVIIFLSDGDGNMCTRPVDGLVSGGGGGGDDGDSGMRCYRVRLQLVNIHYSVFIKV